MGVDRYLALGSDEFNAAWKLFQEQFPIPEGISHPAPFPKEVIAECVRIFAERVEGKYLKVLDPFAGVGRVHVLNYMVEGCWVDTYGMEIEEEWAVVHRHTVCGDSTLEAWIDETFDAIVTSPPYGNRLADGPSKGSKRISYADGLGRKLSPFNSAKYQWGDMYRDLNLTVARRCFKALKPGGFALWNVKDHIRNHKRVPVVAWHIDMMQSVGFELGSIAAVATHSYRRGANPDARVGTGEVLLTFEKP